MVDNNTVKECILQNEERDELLFEDPTNPYESVYIRAKILEGRLTILDSECGHAPDGVWTYREIVFDSENTEKVIAFLLEIDQEPFKALKGMLGYERTWDFCNACDERGIKYKEFFSF